MVGQYNFRFLFARRILAVSDRTPSSPRQIAVYFRSVAGRYYGVQRARSLGGTCELQDTRIASTTQTRFVLWNPSRSFTTACSCCREPGRVHTHKL